MKTQASPAAEQDGTLNIHEEHLRVTACGFDRDLTLKADTVQSVAQHLRGIIAVSAVLSIENQDITLGEWLRCGLVEAVQGLAFNAYSQLDRVNTHARKAMG